FDKQLKQLFIVMTTSRSQDNSKLFIPIEECSRDRLINKDFEYPLSCIFRILTIDPKTNREISVYERKKYQAKPML
ncbi:unnamed protein product, partial [Rotaria sp. Silwood2]